MSRAAPGIRPVDAAVLAYAAVTGAVVLGAGAVGPGVPHAVGLLAARAGLAAFIVALAKAPPSSARRAARALYPLLVCPLFFWEAPGLAGALWAGSPWWFEARLEAVDVALFGGPSTPAAFSVPSGVAEVLWLFYFAYYPLVAGGLVAAWRGPGPSGPAGGDAPEGRSRPATPHAERPATRGPIPSAAFEPVLTAAVLGFLGAYAAFPFLPARAPIHAVAGVAPAAGGVFGAAVGWVQTWGGVTGGAFPSAHVSASWAIVVALAPYRRRAGRLLGVVAAGMTAACVYTPYHWVADVGAGLLLGIVAGVAGRRLVEGRRGREGPRTGTG